MADDWFRLMKNKGWYVVPQASTNLSNQMANHLQNLERQSKQFVQNMSHQQQSQYNQNQGTRNFTNTNQQYINPISGLSENKPTMTQQSGVNSYGASYSSGNDYGQ